MIQGKGILKGLGKRFEGKKNDPWYTGIKSPGNKHNFKYHYVHNGWKYNVKKKTH